MFGELNEGGEGGGDCLLQGQDKCAEYKAPGGTRSIECGDCLAFYVARVLMTIVGKKRARLLEDLSYGALPERFAIHP